MGCEEAKVDLDTLRGMIIRKAWRQEDFERFEDLVGEDPRYALALARMKGKEALINYAASHEGIDASLATVSLIEPLNEALVKMRRIPAMKDIAEGWIAFTKGDLKRADASFNRAESSQPIRARIGKGVCTLLSGQKSAAQELLAPLQLFGIKKSPCSHDSWNGIRRKRN